jgi:acetyltransferase-like isoleucine patch superfamily enzyme
MKKMTQSTYYIPEKIYFYLSKLRARHEFGINGRVSLKSEISTPSRIELSDGVSILDGSFISAGSSGTISIGAESSIRRYVYLVGDIDIGDNVMIAPKAGLFAHNHGHKLGTIMQDQPLEDGKITVGNDVWIGSNAIITPNVELKSGSVIGAGAVVTDNVPSNTIVGGNPAKEIRKRQP